MCRYGLQREGRRRTEDERPGTGFRIGGSLGEQFFESFPVFLGCRQVSLDVDVYDGA